MSINYQELVPEKALGKEISRHIFQTYRAKTGLPHEVEQNIEHIKRLNPEYEYHLFDDEDIKAFILEHYGEVIWGYYQRIAPIYGAARPPALRQVRQVLSLRTLSHAASSATRSPPASSSHAPTHKKRIAVGDAPTAIRFLLSQEARRPYYSWAI